MNRDTNDTRLMMHEYEADQEATLKKMQEEYNSMALTYKEALKEGGGLEVLEDLRSKFKSAASFVPGRNLDDVCYFEGQKSVIDYIEALLSFKI